MSVETGQRGVAVPATAAAPTIAPTTRAFSFRRAHPSERGDSRRQQRARRERSARRPGLLAGAGSLGCLAAAAGMLAIGWARPAGPSSVAFSEAGLPPAAASLPGTPAAALTGTPYAMGLPPVPAWYQYPGEIVTSDTLQGDAPNPYIYFADGRYYMYSSQGNVLAVHANIPMRTSADMVDWSAPVDAMPTLPSWAESGLNWSPDVHYVDGRFVMWFSAVTQGIDHPRTGDDLMKCIGWATAAQAAGPFVPDPASQPPICQVSHEGSIDPHMFEAPDGSLWLVWKSDDNASVDQSATTTIWIQQLESDGTTVTGDPVALISPTESWQWRVVENGQMVYGGGRYWLFYSSNSFSSPAYSIDYDSCAGPTGPCSDPQILLGSNAQGQGPGEAEVFYDAQAQPWIAYAPWAQNPKSYIPRPVALARLGFGPSGPYLARP